MHLSIIIDTNNKSDYGLNYVTIEIVNESNIKDIIRPQSMTATSTSSTSSSSMTASPARKKAPTFIRVKELTPALADKECSFKVIVMESNAKDDANTSANATLLVGDDSGCVSLVLPKSVAAHVRLGDILHLLQTQVVFKNSRIYLWGGKVERVGEFILLFKESYNVSTITWVKDPNNPDAMVRHCVCVCARALVHSSLTDQALDGLTRVLAWLVDPWSEPCEAIEAARATCRSLDVCYCCICESVA